MSKPLIHCSGKYIAKKKDHIHIMVSYYET